MFKLRIEVKFSLLKEVVIAIFPEYSADSEYTDINIYFQVLG
jgi:hypothetical protein